MALTSTEKAQLAEILGIPDASLLSLELATIDGSSQETILKADLARFQVIRGQYGDLNGKDGVVFSFSEERGDIKQRIIRKLDCSTLVAYYDSLNGGSGGGSMTLMRA